MVKVYCNSCGKYIYNLEESPACQKIVDATDFEPALYDLRPPVNEEETKCPLCGKCFVIISAGIYINTDQGLLP